MLALSELCEDAKAKSTKSRARLEAKLANRYWTMPIVTGLATATRCAWNEFYAVAQQLFMFDRERISYQHPQLVEAQHHPDQQTSNAQEDFEWHRSCIEKDRDRITSRIQQLREIHSEDALKPFDPTWALKARLERNLISDAKGIRDAYVNYFLLTFPNIREISVNTTSNGDGAHILWILRNAINTGPGNMSPLRQMFNLLRIATIVSEDQVAYGKEGSDGPALAKACAQSHRAVRLMQGFSHIPRLEVVRAFGLHITQDKDSIDISKEVYDATRWSTHIRVHNVVIKRSSATTDKLIDLVQRTTDLRLLTYDHCPPDRIWRLSYASEHKICPATQKAFDLSQVWNPETLIIALETTKAVKSLHTLDLSSEMAQIPLNILAYKITSLKAFTSLRYVGLHTASLPTQPHSGIEIHSSDILYVPLHDFLPDSIIKIHLCGNLLPSGTNALFGPYLFLFAECLLELAHVVSDQPFPFEENMLEQAKLSVRVCFEYQMRREEVRLVGLDERWRDDDVGQEYQEEVRVRGLLGLESIWNYPDLKTVKEGGGYIRSVWGEVEGEGSERRW